MKKFHIAISTDKIEETVREYTKRLGAEPCSLIAGEYALWRTDVVNFSIRYDPSCEPGTLRHMGWEDPEAHGFSQDMDVNGVVWERFNPQHQADEINSIWPGAQYEPDA